MKPIKQQRPIIMLLALWCVVATVSAQDAKPHQLDADDYDAEEIEEVQLPDSVPDDKVTSFFAHLTLPVSFQHTAANQLLHPEYLATFFEKVRARKVRSACVVQIGDSHIRGHVLPLALRRSLEEAWGSEAMLPAQINYHTDALARTTGVPGFVFHAIGKNGATLNYYLDEGRQREIARLNPDLIIVSLGTNESHGVFETAAYTMQLDAFTSRMQQLCPGVTFLFTTPPGSHITTYRTVRRKRRGRTYKKRVAAGRVPNNVAGRVAACQRNYGASRGYAVWDLYEIAGGDLRACANWRTAGLMAGDGIHYTHTAYNIQGDLLGEALINAYNETQRR